MEQLDSSVSSSSKPHSYASGISSNPPKTSRRLSYPKQPTNDSLSSSSNNAAHTNGVKVVRNPNGSVSYQKLSRNTSSDSLQHEELASIAKRIYHSKIGKSESLGKGKALNIDQKKVLTLEDKSCLVRSVNGLENSNGNAGFGSENVVSDPKGGFAKINNHITSPSETSFCTSPSSSLCAASQFLEAKESFTNTEISECASSIEKSVESSDVSQSYDFIEGRKMSMYRGSTGSDVSEESSSSSLSSALLKPHKANDTRWEAIQAVKSRVGVLEVKHFRLLRRLGCGDIGQVFLSELTGTRSYFAMKVMDKSLLASRKKLLRAQTEREILQCLDHPFLPTLYTHFETEKFSCLLMEFCPGGDLHALRQKQPGKFFSEHAARFYVAEVLLALEYLHMLGIIYRDLKPENVLVREDGHIMLSDFDLSLRCAVCPTLVRSTHPGLESKNSGYCVQPACIEPTCAIQPNCIQPSCFGPRIFPSKSKKEKKSKGKNEMNHQVSPLPELIAEPTNARSMSFVGTHEYLAPEIIKGEGHGSAVDWWTFGIFLYELLFGKTPFKGRENRATLFNVVGQPLKFPDYPTVSFAARDLIRGLLVKEPQHRLAYRRGATEIKQHPFFQSVNWALIRCTSPPEVPKPVIGELHAMTNVKSSDNYLEIDFF